MSKITSEPVPTCPYREVCAHCPGSAWTRFDVVLNSGEIVEFADVKDIQVEGEVLIVTPGAAGPQRFNLRDVYYAGCAEAMPPFPG